MFLESMAAFWFSVISVIAIPANISVIVIIYLKKIDNLDYYHFLLMTQSCRDILLNVLVNFYTVATLVHGEIVLSRDCCRLSAYFSRVWYFGTALTLCAATTERYNSIKHCLNHNRSITLKRLFTAVVVLNIFPLLAGLPLALGKTKFLHVTTMYGCTNDAKVLDVHDAEVQISGFVLLMLFLVVPIFAILRTSIKMYLLVRRHKRTIAINQPGEILPPTKNTNETLQKEQDKICNVEKIKQKSDAFIHTARQIQVVKNVLIINSGFLLSLMPILIIKLYARLYDENLTTTPTWLILLIYWVNYCCTIWNPVTNALRRREFSCVLTKALVRLKLRAANTCSQFRGDESSERQVNFKSPSVLGQTQDYQKSDPV